MTKIMVKKQKINELTPIYSDFLISIPDVRRVPEFFEFARWCALPHWLRDPKTQKELAERIGVSQDTLTDCKKHPEFWPLVFQLLREWMREHAPDVIGGLYDKIVSAKGSAKDVKLFLGLSGNYSKEIKSKKNYG